MASGETLQKVGTGGTEYICVLCGSIWTSDEYNWGKCTEVRSGSIARCDWSCPQCGGVVVEYARHARPVYEVESIPVGPHA
ncbi:MAG TPA: hypothetical protein VMT60_03780 [Candidatus Bathyarchaeia archaeon]|nr:hypothetical protein [Candidatus Bathyarchaeia archaeon]